MKREQILRMLGNMDAGAMKQANEILSLGEAVGVDVVTEPEPELPVGHCRACSDTAWRIETCTAGVKRVVCLCCEHPSYDCYCGDCGGE